MGISRAVFVAVPFALTFASFACIFTILLSGISSKNFNLFEINTEKLGAQVSSLTDIAKELSKTNTGWSNAGASTAHLIDEIKSGLNLPAIPKDPAQIAASAAQNITASELGLADKYKIYLWNYCAITGTEVICSTPKFGWASENINIENLEERTSAAAGIEIKFPEKITKPIESFIAITRLTQISYAFAAFGCLLMFAFGIFAFYSRAGSCITTVICFFAALSIIVASVTATVEATVVTAAIESLSLLYGVKAKVNFITLALIWLAVIFIIIAGLFWTLTSCCCASNRSPARSFHNPARQDPEKPKITGTYHRVAEPNFDDANYTHGAQGPSISNNLKPYGPQVRNQRLKNGSSYEPYAHTAI